MIVLLLIFVTDMLYAMGAYTVTTDGDYLILVCDSHETIRLHTSSEAIPWQNLDCNKNTHIRVAPGQWVEGYIGPPSAGKMTYLTDADNR